MIRIDGDRVRYEGISDQEFGQLSAALHDSGFHIMPLGSVLPANIAGYPRMACDVSIPVPVGYFIAGSVFRLEKPFTPVLAPYIDRVKNIFDQFLEHGNDRTKESQERHRSW